MIGGSGKDAQSRVGDSAGGAENMVFQEAIREVEGVEFKGIIYSSLFLQEAGSKI